MPPTITKLLSSGTPLWRCCDSTSVTRLYSAQDAANWQEAYHSNELVLWFDQTVDLDAA